jgi:hypothetical protein
MCKRLTIQTFGLRHLQCPPLGLSMSSNIPFCLQPLEFATFSLIAKRRTIAGSMIGSIEETQEMINYCGELDLGHVVPPQERHLYGTFLTCTTAEKAIAS